MRKLLVVAFLLGGVVPAALEAQSPWRLLANETVVLKKTCIGSEGVEETAAGVTAWYKDSYASPQTLAGGKTFTVAKAEILVDCVASRWKMIRAVAFNGSGDPVFDDSKAASEFQAFGDGSMGADLAKAACGMVQLKRQRAAANAS